MGKRKAVANEMERKKNRRQWAGGIGELASNDGEERIQAGQK